MNILALVLAGGEGSRLYPLTAAHAKPALPFVNGYKIIDFVLSNLANSGIASVYVLAQYKPRSLIEHLGCAWAPRFSARGGFLEVICPNSAAGEKPFKGTADAVHQNLRLLERHAPDLVAVFAADHADPKRISRVPTLPEAPGACAFACIATLRVRTQARTR